MFKKIISNFVGFLILSLFASGIVSFAMECVPYFLFAIVLAAPFYGEVRRRKTGLQDCYFFLKCSAFVKSL